MSFLCSCISIGERPKGQEVTRSSSTSLNALARRTSARGAIVVYLFVGDTPGICWMIAKDDIRQRSK